MNIYIKKELRYKNTEILTEYHQQVIGPEVSGISEDIFGFPQSVVIIGAGPGEWEIR